jgi:hypothetical protein
MGNKTDNAIASEDSIAAPAAAHQQ